jgi:hypothetical protein
MGRLLLLVLAEADVRDLGTEQQGSCRSSACIVAVSLPVDVDRKNQNPILQKYCNE